MEWLLQNSIVEIIMEWLLQNSISRGISAQKTLRSTFFSLKKTSVRYPQNGRFSDFETETQTLFGNRTFFFTKFNSYSFFGWPGITMSVKSLHNYFGITVKSRKNHEKIGFSDFWLWSRNNYEMIATE